MRLGTAAVFGLLASLLTGCDRESRPVDKPQAAESSPINVALTDLHPGAAPLRTSDPRAAEYEGNAFHIAQGQRYFAWFNCNGCHANGGGGMGPALMDDSWRYGDAMEQIYATIVQGRPNGMPSFQDKIPEQQVWQLAAFVRSLSGQADKLAAPSRLDGMRSIPPINNIDPPKREGGDDASVRGGG